MVSASCHSTYVWYCVVCPASWFIACSGIGSSMRYCPPPVLQQFTEPIILPIPVDSNRWRRVHYKLVWASTATSSCHIFYNIESATLQIYARIRHRQLLVGKFQIGRFLYYWMSKLNNHHSFYVWLYRLSTLPYLSQLFFTQSKKLKQQDF